jgi:hypothetical protein
MVEASVGKYAEGERGEEAGLVGCVFGDGGGEATFMVNVGVVG